jgi:hypothetical protein
MYLNRSFMTLITMFVSYFDSGGGGTLILEHPTIKFGHGEREKEAGLLRPK